MEQYLTFERIAFINSLMQRFHITAEQAAELAADILN